VDKKRVRLFFLLLAISIIIIFVSSSLPVSVTSANETQTKVDNQVHDLKASNSLMQFIFGNNLIISIVMMLPFAGTGFGMFVLFNTGKVIGAEAVAQSVSPLVMNVALFSTPVFWLEFFAYSLAMTESIIFTYYAITHRARQEIPKLAISLSLCVGALFVGAILEALIINGYGVASTILFGIGVVALGSYTLIRRRRNDKLLPF
jgi:hypothetical protein